MINHLFYSSRVIAHSCFSSSQEGRYSQLAPRSPNRPQARWDFYYNLRRGPGHVLADVSFIHPLAASYIRSTAAPLAMPPLFGTPTSARTTLPTTTARDMHFGRSLLKPMGGSDLGPCNSSAKPPMPLSPNRGTSVPSAASMCTASFPLCSVVMYLVCSPLQRAFTPHAQVLAGSGAHRCPHQRFRTRHAGAAAGFVCVGRCLGSDCVLLMVVVLC
jgi:hypothetical protein